MFEAGSMPGNRSLRCIVVGAGVSGILSAIKLSQDGYTDFTIYEKADRLGGTWRDNTYPGVACDIPSHLYSYSFAPNPDWSRHYAPGQEIQEYLLAVARKFGVEKHVRFNEEVTRCEFAQGRWHVRTRSGTSDSADVLIAATGVLHHPHIPPIPGFDAFGGPVFHSARWRNDVDLADQRVGIVGTGASAVQIVPAIIDRVKRLAVFQRTPQWIMPQENPMFTDEEKAKFRTQPEKMRRLRAMLEHHFVENFSDVVIDANAGSLRIIEEMCREHLETQVRDPVLRKRLRPNYRAACKRLVVSSEFYPAMQKPHVDLVTECIERMEPSGVRTGDGRLIELDILILATGFHFERFIRPVEVIGRDSKRLTEVWTPRPFAYLCVTVPDFPNFFMLNGPNGPVGNFPLIEVAELQMGYLLQLLKLLRVARHRQFSPRMDATAAFENARIAAAKKTVWTTGCSSWYLDAEGVPALWPWTIQKFRESLARPTLDDYELS